MGKAKGKPLELHLLREAVNQQQENILQVIVKISATIKDFNEVGVGDSYDAPMQLTYLPCAGDSVIADNGSG